MGKMYCVYSFTYYIAAVCQHGMLLRGLMVQTKAASAPRREECSFLEFLRPAAVPPNVATDIFALLNPNIGCTTGRVPSAQHSSCHL